MMVDMLKQKARGLLAKKGRIHVHRGKRRIGKLSQGIVVKRYHAYLRRNTQPTRARRLQKAKGAHIIVAEERVRMIGSRKRLCRNALSVLYGAIRGINQRVLLFNPFLIALYAALLKPVRPSPPK